MNIGEILAALRKESGKSQTCVAEYMSGQGRPVTQKAISKWEQGDTLPDAEQFLLLCRLYGVSDVLSVFAEEEDGGALNSLGTQKLLEYLRLLQSSDKYLAKPRHSRMLPLYDLPVSAGTGHFLDSDRYEMIPVDAAVPQAANFAVRVSGDSMTPAFRDGQVVYVKQQPVLEKGEIGIFLLNGDAYLKQLMADEGGMQLISFNPRYAPISVEEWDEFRILGKVVV